MNSSKYTQGKRITSISEFDACESLWYKWNGKTTHRSVLMSLQYRTLLNLIKNGCIYTAEAPPRFKVGQYIIYHNGERYELGRIKSLLQNGAFVAYNEGDTGAMTAYELMHPLFNEYCIKETTLGGDFFENSEK